MLVRALSGGGSNNIYYEMYPNPTTTASRLEYEVTMSFDLKHVWFTLPTSSTTNIEAIFHYDIENNTLRSKSYAYPSTEADQDAYIGDIVSYDSATRKLTIHSPWSVAKSYVSIVAIG